MRSEPSSDVLDVVAVGAGPANLSLAALADPLDDLSLVVLEGQPQFRWHPGMLFVNATVQTAPLKDLVTLVDPTSRYSFLNFLASEGRLYRHLVAARESVTRREFQQYYAWVAGRLRSVRFGVRVERLDHEGGTFVLYTSDGVWRARNVVVGIGQVPCVPKFVEPLLGPGVFHSSEYLSGAHRDFAGREVLLVGGGQSAADVATHLLADRRGLPRRLIWPSGRTGLLPLDDSPFSNEWFNPRYSKYFSRLDAARRRELLEAQLLASDGVTESVLLGIYRRLYELDYIEEIEFDHELLAGHRLIALTEADGGYEAILYSPDTADERVVCADAVILATGYGSRLPSFLAPLHPRLLFDESGDYVVAGDYRLGWDGPAEQGIFVQSAARATHGIADPNLSLASWRSAVILNRICGRGAYAVDRDDATLSLRDAPDAALAAQHEEIPGLDRS